MLDLYAHTFMTATRQDCVRLREVPTAVQKKRFGWFKGPKTRCVDLNKL